MSSVATQFGQSFSNHPLRMAFLRWQCRVRQIAMREREGRPDDGIMPDVYLPGEEAPMGAIITVLNKSPEYSLTPELQHMAARTNDPAERRAKAIEFLSASYYQKAAEFSDILTSTFAPGSPGAERLASAGRCRLVFDAYGQRFDLDCEVSRLAPNNLLHKATMAHNRLFNPAILPGTEVLGFEPDWERSTSEPPFA